MAGSFSGSGTHPFALVKGTLLLGQALEQLLVGLCDLNKLALAALLVEALVREGVVLVVNAAPRLYGMEWRRAGVQEEGWRRKVLRRCVPRPRLTDMILLIFSSKRRLSRSTCERAMEREREQKVEGSRRSAPGCGEGSSTFHPPPAPALPAPPPAGSS